MILNFPSCNLGTMDFFSRRPKHCKSNCPLSGADPLWISHHLEKSDEVFGRELIGVAAHVYADTFAHYGFSGVSSRWNKVINDSIEPDIDDPDMKSKLMDGLDAFLGKFYVDFPNFRRKVISGTAETATGALGHGPVGTFPDMPFLWWCFDYEKDKGDETTSGRKNDQTFLSACKALHGMFQCFVEKSPQYKDGNGGRAFQDIEKSVIDVLEFVGTTEERVNKWINEAGQGKFFDITEGRVPLHQDERWTHDLKQFENSTHSQACVSSSAYRFFQAASMHRNYVLRDLMPEYGLVIV